jgi:hypothetical protein
MMCADERENLVVGAAVWMIDAADRAACWTRPIGLPRARRHLKTRALRLRSARSLGGGFLEVLAVFVDWHWMAPPVRLMVVVAIQTDHGRWIPSHEFGSPQSPRAAERWVISEGGVDGCVESG